MEWYLRVIRNYIGFSGRARRKEFWMFILVNAFVTAVISILDKILGWNLGDDDGVLSIIYSLLIFLPSLAVQFRRLHDVERSAWWLLLMFIPVVGWVALIVFSCQSGTPGYNNFGPDPKQKA